MLTELHLDYLGTAVGSIVSAIGSIVCHGSSRVVPRKDDVQTCDEMALPDSRPGRHRRAASPIRVLAAGPRATYSRIKGLDFAFCLLPFVRDSDSARHIILHM